MHALYIYSVNAIQPETLVAIYSVASYIIIYNSKEALSNYFIYILNLVYILYIYIYHLKK